MRSRTLTAAAVLVASLALSAAVWYYTGHPFAFLFVPFVPFLFRGGDDAASRTCPECGFSTRREEYEFCPRDGTGLRE